MATNYKDTNVTGFITPVANGTRVRLAPTTFSTVCSGANKGDKIIIDVVREYTETDQNLYITVGDKWGRVVSINGKPVLDASGNAVIECWVAIKYQRVSPSTISTESYKVVEVPTVEKKWVGALLTPIYEDGSNGETIRLRVE